LKREVIVVGAHYDHVGYGSQSNSFGPWGYVHNGADDNASGISGLLEVIDAMLAAKPAPRRSVLFAFFDGEEKGLLGSKHWVAQPTVPRTHIACMINVDMIGRMQHDRVEIYGWPAAACQRKQSADGIKAGFQLGDEREQRSLFVFRSAHSDADGAHRFA
jgi:Zn-dependent M28 family amino/carboxypeptidase